MTFSTGTSFSTTTVSFTTFSTGTAFSTTTVCTTCFSTGTAFSTTTVTGFSMTYGVGWAQLAANTPTAARAEARKKSRRLNDCSLDICFSSFCIS